MHLTQHFNMNFLVLYTIANYMINPNFQYGIYTCKNRLREYKLAYQTSSPPHIKKKKKKMGGWWDQGEVSVNFIWMHGLN